MRKVLFISYFFPPVGGGGVIRIAKFAKYLPFFGWQPFILTVKKAPYPFRDRELLKELPREVQIKKINYFEPAFWFKNRWWQSFLSYLIYPLFLIPDRQILWLMPAIIAARKIIKKEDIKVIFTSSAPASDHLVGWFLKKLTKVNWVADFRDEWTSNPLQKFPTPLHRWFNKIMEKRVVSQSDEIISVAPTLTEYFVSLTADKKKFQTISNGYDSDDFKDLQDFRNKKYCQIIYTGSLYNHHLRDNFLEALRELQLKDLKVDFIGVDRRVSHLEAVRSLARADILLLILDPVERPAVFTGKLYEYLAARKPILALAPKNSGAAKFIKHLKLGEIASPLDKDEIKSKIFKMYQCWQKNQLTIPQIDIKRYDRRNLTRRLAATFEKISSYPKKIKLCLIGNLISPQNRNLVDYLKTKNYEIYFISTQPGKVPGVRSYWLGRKFFSPLYFLLSLFKIRRLVQKISPDVIHGQDLVFGGIWAYFSGFRPVVVTPWGSDVMNYEKFIRIEKYFIKKTLQKADLVTVSSEALREKAQKIGMAKEKSALVHFGINLDIFKKQKVEHLRRKYKLGSSKIIYSPRSIAPIYNTEILIAAFVMIANKGNYKLILTEQNADQSFLIEIEKLIIKYNLIDKVIFLPSLPFSEIPKFYNLADVVASLTSSDGCSVSFLEAMASEKKIVVTDLPYIQEWKQDRNLWMTPVRDIKKTAKALFEALKFPENKWHKIGKTNRRLIAERAEIAANFDKLDKLYRGLR